MGIHSSNTNSKMQDSFSISPFGEMRVAAPVTLFDSKQVANNQAFFWDDAQATGTGTSSTYNANQASSTLAVGAATAGTRVRQTKVRGNQLWQTSFFLHVTPPVSVVALVAVMPKNEIQERYPYSTPIVLQPTVRDNHPHDE